MGDVQQVRTAAKAALEFASRCEGDELSDNYGLLIERVDELQGEAREAFQAQVDFASLLPKLKQKQPLAANDLKTLEQLIVGDAEYYLKYETHFEGWKAEARQLFGEIDKLESSQMDGDGLMHLRAVCRELARVLPDIVFYLDAKERAAKFKQATQGTIDAEGYLFLAEIVERMSCSDKM